MRSVAAKVGHPLKRQLRRAVDSRFARDVATLVTGSAIAQAIALAFSPVITRIYDPEQFGIYSTFMAIAQVLIPVAGLSYPLAMVLPSSDADARGIGKLAVGVAVTTSVLLALAILIVEQTASSNLIPGLSNTYLYLLPLLIPPAAWLQALQYWMIRKSMFRITARIAVLQSLAVNSAKVVTGWWYPIGAVLIFITFLGTILHGSMMRFAARGDFRGLRAEHGSKPLEMNRVRRLAADYSEFPVYRAPQALLNALSQGIPVILLGSYFGASAAAFYAIAKTALGAPLQLIGRALTDAFYPRFVQAAREKADLRKYLVRTTVALAAVGILPFSVVVVFGPFLFDLVFGSEWSTAGHYARWVAIWYFFAFLNRPSVSAVAVLNLNAGFLVYEVGSAVLKLGTLMAGFAILKDPVSVIAVFSGAGAVLNLALIAYVLLKSGPGKINDGSPGT